MIEPLTIPKFLAGWVPALAVSAAVPEPALSDIAVIDIGGLPVPVITCVLGLLGIFMSRPLARRGEAELSWTLFLLVSAIMLIIVQLWIIESRPSWLFAFVVSIGMGFSGYSLIELMGEQVQSFFRTVFERTKSTIGRAPGNGDSQ